NFGAFSVQSADLAKNLYGCESVLLFAATVGVGIDRLISKYSRISPARSVIIDALGAERIEALCDALCEDFALENKAKLKPRFSPGYDDLPLEAQKDVFAVLDCPRKIGLSLNDSLLMSPTKSVTAFAGIVREV
ncbi:MAG: Vitamin B12 dependent methionine synthase activation subunit, partial [Clostridiales bacterium]|nr:Vitamin B12 dependent methionine synthase activation subunit [Clostridiales bacterium]